MPAALGAAALMNGRPLTSPTSESGTGRFISTDGLYDDFQKAARRRIMLTRNPTPMTDEDIDIKPYNPLIAPPTSSIRAKSAGRTFSPDAVPDHIMKAFKNTDRLRTGSSRGRMPSVESSGIGHSDKTALIISILKTNITPPHNPDLAGVGHYSPVRRFYTINNMFAQIF